MTEELPGILVVLSGPSGVGKTSVAQRLIDLGGYVRSVSVTTRRPRQNEVDGRDYRFVTEPEFKTLLDTGELIEHAVVHGNKYGTPKQPLREAIKLGMAYLLVIDVEGGSQLRGKGYDSLLLFLAPPDQDELARRLASRGTEDTGQQTERLKAAEIEMRRAATVYNHIVVNRELKECVDEVHGLVTQARENLKQRELAGETLYPGLNLKE